MNPEDYLPLVKYIVGRMQVKLPPFMDQEDLISSGIFGLLDAIKKYDPARGIKFETYATPRIRGAVLDAVRKANWAPRSTYEQLKKYNQTLQRLEQRYGREVSDQEVADEMAVSLEEINRILMDANSLSVESLENFLLTSEESQLTLGDTVVDENSADPEKEYEEIELKEALASAIKRLNEKDRLLLNLYYYEGLTLKEIGQVLEVSESRVSQLHARALTRLRGELKEYEVKF